MTDESITSGLHLFSNNASMGRLSSGDDQRKAAEFAIKMQKEIFEADQKRAKEARDAEIERLKNIISDAYEDGYSQAMIDVSEL